jgi:hypothetical protein
MKQPNYPSLYQVNTRVWLTEISERIGRPATLDDIPDADLDHFVDLGFDWIWFQSVWTTGKAAQKVSREDQEWRHEFQETLPDLREHSVFRNGQWRLLEPLPAWEGNNSFESFLAFAWEDEYENLAMVVVN